MKKIICILIPILAIAAIAFLGIRYHLANRMIFNDSYINGNTAGNLYNAGLFCERGGMVYFSNPNDHHYLYSMDTATGETKKLYDDVASYINADDNYVYYVRNNANSDDQFAFLHYNTNSLCRYSLRTKKVELLDMEPSIYASLIGNYIYYIHYSTEDSSTLYRVKIDGTEKEQVDELPYFTCSANGQYLYYNGIQKDHNIYQYDTATAISQAIILGNYWMPSADNENIYFLDCEQNYALMQLNRSQTTPKMLVSDRIESYNVYGDTVYFQRNNLNGDAALCRIGTDGSNYQVIVEGNFSNINVTSQYVYFNETDNTKTVYQFPTGGGGTFSKFNP